MLEIFSILAVWRIVHALMDEDGPFMLIAKIREFIKKFSETLIECPYCLSAWVAIPFTLLFAINPIVAWLALSAGAILVEVIHERLTE